MGHTHGDTRTHTSAHPHTQSHRYVVRTMREQQQTTNGNYNKHADVLWHFLFFLFTDFYSLFEDTQMTHLGDVITTTTTGPTRRLVHPRPLSLSLILSPSRSYEWCLALALRHKPNGHIKRIKKLFSHWIHELAALITDRQTERGRKEERGGGRAAGPNPLM